jgi:hypothetical protein
MTQTERVPLPPRWVLPLAISVVVLALNGSRVLQTFGEGIGSARGGEIATLLFVGYCVLWTLFSIKRRYLTIAVRDSEIELCEGSKVLYRGPHGSIVMTRETKKAIYLNLPNHLQDLSVSKKHLSKSLKFLLTKGRKGGEPGATDNPDDAQRLREDQ